jgi:hypothetical protein
LRLAAHSPDFVEAPWNTGQERSTLIRSLDRCPDPSSGRGSRHGRAWEVIVVMTTRTL